MLGLGLGSWVRKRISDILQEWLVLGSGGDKGGAAMIQQEWGRDEGGAAMIQQERGEVEG